jgi:glycosyltransferase involved in cell wall biosynthesis
VHIVHTIDNMYLDRGGPVAVVIGLTAAQAAAGDRVTVVCRAQLRSGEAKSLAHALAPGVELVEVGCSGVSGVREALDRLCPELLHVHGVWEPFHRWCTDWATVRSVPWVVSTHGMLHPVPMSKGWIKKRVYLFLLGRAVNRARRLLVTSVEEREYATQITGVSAAVLVNGVNIAEFADADPHAFVVTHPQFANRPYLLFLGRIHAIKGITGLVRAFALARTRGLDANLVLAGPPDGAESEVMQLVHALGIASDVHLVGPLYGKEKMAALAGCKLFVHRPTYEGFGMTVIEAMASGRPVVTTNACGVARELAQGMLDVSADTDSAFAEAVLHRISANPAETEAMATRGRTWVQQNLSWDAVARQTRALYR